MKCNICDKEMEQGGACSGALIEFPDGQKLAPLVYVGPGHNCHDCGVRVLQPHHSGCDMERCPRCGGQLISCGCLSGENPDPGEPVDPLDHMAEGAIDRYLYKYYIPMHCTLCANSGWIDTRGIKTGAGVEVGCRQYCLCPNGRAMRRASEAT